MPEEIYDKVMGEGSGSGSSPGSDQNISTGVSEGGAASISMSPKDFEAQIEAAVQKVHAERDKVDARVRISDATAELERVKIPEINKILAGDSDYVSNSDFKDAIDKHIENVGTRAIEQAATGNWSYLESIDGRFVNSALAAVKAYMGISTDVEVKTEGTETAAKKESVKISGIPEQGSQEAAPNNESFLTEDSIKELMDHDYNVSDYNRDLKSENTKLIASWGVGSIDSPSEISDGGTNG